MDSEVSLLLERAENELLIARTLKKLSEDESRAVSLKISRGVHFIIQLYPMRIMQYFIAPKLILSD